MDRAAKVEFDRFEAAVGVVDVHAAGEPCRVAVGGFPEPQGDTMIEKRRWMEEHADGLRRALMHEPRGHHDMFGAFLCDPVDPRAHVGVVFMDTGDYLNMCGHGTIGVVTVVVETGIVGAHEGENEIVLDTPAGLIRATARVEQGTVASVSFENVPSFVYRENVVAEVEGRQISLDIAFGGSFFALVDAAGLGLGEIGPANASAYAHLGTLVRETVNRTVALKHPTLDIDAVDLVEFYDCAPDSSAGSMRHLVVFGAGSVDRSPCGTGLSAHLAALRHRGAIACGEPVRCESFIGTSFTGVVDRETTVGGFDAVIPRIAGRAFLTSAGTCLIDAADPLRYGFLPGC
ncbi:MAG: proline racemase family protein [Gordonibacter sp.]|uniref:proline racemase family protein n=2 Tax=Gordonibacter sp. TaxID=1968902 RepID=UPI002FC76B6E